MLIIASATPAGAAELRLLVARGTCSNNFDGWLIKAAAGTRSFIHCCCCCCCFLLVSKPGEARLIYFANYFTCSRRGLLQDTKWRYKYIKYLLATTADFAPPALSSLSLLSAPSAAINHIIILNRLWANLNCSRKPKSKSRELPALQPNSLSIVSANIFSFKHFSRSISSNIF